MATLKELVNEVATIKNELKTCHTNLKNNLASKGVTIASSDKIASLINKIPSISTATKVSASDNVLINFIGSDRNTDVLTAPGTATGSTKVPLCVFNFKNPFVGSLRLYLEAYSGTYWKYIMLKFVKNGQELKTLSFSAQSTAFSVDFTNISKNDVIEIYAYQTLNTGNHSFGIKTLQIRGDIQ